MRELGSQMLWGHQLKATGGIWVFNVGQEHTPWPGGTLTQTGLLVLKLRPGVSNTSRLGGGARGHARSAPPVRARFAPPRSPISSFSSCDLA